MTSTPCSVGPVYRKLRCTISATPRPPSLLLAGVHPKVVSERHGHASTQITLDRYSHVLESMQEAAADAIGRFLRPDETPVSQ